MQYETIEKSQKLGSITILNNIKTYIKLFELRLFESSFEKCWYGPTEHAEGFMNTIKDFIAPLCINKNRK